MCGAAVAAACAVSATGLSATSGCTTAVTAPPASREGMASAFHSWAEASRERGQLASALPMTARRFTKREWKAIVTALNNSLVMEVIDGYEDDSDEEADKRAAMHSALVKVWDRLGPSPKGTRE